MKTPVLVDREALAWAAGLFEGEGCFTNAKRGRPIASIQMTDRGSLESFHAAVGVGAVYGPYRPYGASRKQTWKWECWTFEDFQAVVAMLWCWLSFRRRMRAFDLLAEALPDQRRRDPVTGRFA